jgi:hypothetical protein
MPNDYNHQCSGWEGDISSLRSELASLRSELASLRTESLAQKAEINNLNLKNKEQEAINKATAEFIIQQKKINEENIKNFKYLNLEVSALSFDMEEAKKDILILKDNIQNAIELAMQHLQTYSQVPKSDYVVLNTIQDITTENMASVVMALGGEGGVSVSPRAPAITAQQASLAPIPSVSKSSKFKSNKYWKATDGSIVADEDIERHEEKYWTEKGLYYDTNDGVVMISGTADGNDHDNYMYAYDTRSGGGQKSVTYNQKTGLWEDTEDFLGYKNIPNKAPVSTYRTYSSPEEALS